VFTRRKIIGMTFILIQALKPVNHQLSPSHTSDTPRPHSLVGVSLFWPQKN
jgi:hypothetical protein